MSDAQLQIKNLLDQHPVVLFMKGTPQFPQCGFSSQVIAILKQYPIEFHSVNVLDDEAIRHGIKDYGDWPTIPQLYVQGQLIGGCDILTELHQKDQLRAQLLIDAS
ncbi:Grx4 family monothiol glutaredoxin [Gammaproteobacteria bacterium]|nr:Grx4 family monothiol glutaredoxin [Gammaproteobacteria bacterium]